MSGSVNDRYDLIGCRPDFTRFGQIGPWKNEDHLTIELAWVFYQQHGTEIFKPVQAIGTHRYQRRFKIIQWHIDKWILRNLGFFLKIF